MFSRRRPSPANVPVDRGTHSAATTAATSAFLHKSTSNASLQSAAAAAALRSYASSPEPVGSIQTKRMVRRGSASSHGSGSVAGNGFARPALSRTSSNGSMTERTFRSPSPSQRNGAMSPTPQRPASSLGQSTRMMSPGPTNGQRSSSADAASRAPPAAARRTNKRLSNVAEVDDELDKAHSDFARNFARRREEEQGIPAAAGAANKYTHGMGSYHQGSSDSALPARPQTSEGRTFSMPSSMRPGAAFSSLRSGPRGGGASSAASNRSARSNASTERAYGIAPGTSYTTPSRVYDPNSRSFVYKSAEQSDKPDSPTDARSSVEMVYDANSRSFVPKQQAMRNEAVEPPRAKSPVTAAPTLAPKKQRAPAVAATPVKAPPKSSAPAAQQDVSPNTARVSSGLHKQPSVVREDPEAEKQAEAAAPAKERPVATNRQSMVLPAKNYTTPTIHQRSASLDVPSLGMEPAVKPRIPSESPQRSARFSPSPVLKPEKHVPPARDVSPAKSAMKHSPASSVRTASPVMTFTPLGIAHTAGPPSETSETPSTASQDGLPKKKKSVRVSFDERAQEIAPPALLASTVAARSTVSSAPADDDIAMQPRPALPSFGSVRRDRMQHEPAEKVTEMPPERHGASSDMALAGILRKNNDPLPPEVTSKETAGYVSDESSEADVPVPAAVSAQPAKAEAPKPSVGATTVRDFAPATQPRPAEDTDVPAINLLPPTPNLSEDSRRDLGAEGWQSNRNSMEGIAVPGGWGGDVEEPQPATETAKPTPEIFDGERRPSAEEPAASPIQLTSSPLPMSDIEEDSDNSAEFSDAVEDVSDLEDEGGFASLDAIVESPMVSTQAKGRAVDSSEVPDSPLTQHAARQAVPATDVAPDSPSSPSGNWDEATAYWSQLSKEKRAEIEREHLPSDSEETRAVSSATTAVPTNDAANGARKLKPKTTQPVDRPASSPSAAKKQQPPQSAMKKTMRSQPSPVAAEPSDGAVHMRRSMRDGGGFGMGSSLRDATSHRRQDSSSSDTPGAFQKKTMRPVSSAGIMSASSAAATGAAMQGSRPQLRSNRHSSDDATLGLRAQKPAAPQQRSEPPRVSARLQKELSQADESDSESSFKKRRRGKTSMESGRFTMRTMRGSSFDQPAPPSPIEQRPASPSPSANGGGRFGRFRSLSPRKKNAAPPAPEPAIRTTMRGTSAPAPKQAQSKPARSTPMSAPRYKSRFADSDDEDERGPAAAAPKRSLFRSRFADSDDEDEPASPVRASASLAPVRGIPRRRGQEDGDSTDLEDEEDAKPSRTMRRSGTTKPPVPNSSEVDKVMELARRNLGMTDVTPPSTSNTTTNEGGALGKGSLRGSPAAPADSSTPASSVKMSDVSFAPPDKKKRGLMGSILRRNRNSTSSVTQIPTTSSPSLSRPASPTVAPVSPVGANKNTNTSPRPDPNSPTRPSIGKLRKNSSSYQSRLSRDNSNFTGIAPASPTTAAKVSDIPPASPSGISDKPPRLPDDILDSWARPSSSRKVSLDRPSTSDGLAPAAVDKSAPTPSRPDLAPRAQSQQFPASVGRRVQIQAGEEGSEPGEREPAAGVGGGAAYSQRTGKKKKFGTLRRVFRLDD